MGGEQEFALLESALFGVFSSMIKESSLRSVVGRSSRSGVTATAFLEGGVEGSSGFEVRVEM